MTDLRVKCVYTSNTALTGTPQTDGYTPQPGETVLAAGQDDGSQNGPYTIPANAGAWTRDPTTLLPGFDVFVRAGLAHGGSRWQLDVEDDVVLGTTWLNFEKYAEGQVLGAADGLTKSGGVITLDEQPALAGGGSVNVGDASVSFTQQGVLTGVSRGYGMRTFLRGLEVQYKNDLDVNVSPGACYLPGADAVRELSVLKSVFTPRSGATHHLIALYAVPDFTNEGGLLFHARDATGEVPVAYEGPAKRNPDTVNYEAYRYLGCVLSLSTAVVARFVCEYYSDSAVLVKYRENTRVAPFRIVSGGTATTVQTVNLGPTGQKLVPPGCKIALIRVVCNSTSGVNIWNSQSAAGLGSAPDLVGAAMVGVYLFVDLAPDQSFNWANTLAGGSTTIDVVGYVDRR